jgi:hypothetical protein
MDVINSITIPLSQQRLIIDRIIEAHTEVAAAAERRSLRTPLWRKRERFARIVDRIQRETGGFDPNTPVSQRYLELTIAVARDFPVMAVVLRVDFCPTCGAISPQNSNKSSPPRNSQKRAAVQLTSYSSSHRTVRETGHLTLVKYSRPDLAFKSSTVY